MCIDKIFAIFFRFTLIKEHLIEFNQLAMANSSGSDDMLNRVMPRDNIGLAALLKTNETAWENCKSLQGFISVTIYCSEVRVHQDFFFNSVLIFYAILTRCLIYL